MKTLESTIEILNDLVGFETISGRPTHAITGYIEHYLKQQGVACSLSFDEAGERANVFATIGPETDGGVVFSGHTDVVPVEGQIWQTDPFKLTAKDGKLFGRGSVDMKGFLASVLASVPAWKQMPLARPIHIAFSYDEETGGLGMPVLLESMSRFAFRPAIVIVGEPTDMKMVTGHKGGYEMRTGIRGLETHSSKPHKGVNAISYAVKLIAKMEQIGGKLAKHPQANSEFDPPYTTINVGVINGGTATNATAGFCTFNWEFRPMPGEDGATIIAEIERYASESLLPEMKRAHPGATIDIITEAAVPALDNRNAALAAQFVCELTGQNSEHVVSFGTDAGYFSDQLFSTVVIGPGSIDRAHKPDEFITKGELADALAFLKKAGEHLSR